MEQQILETEARSTLNTKAQQWARDNAYYLSRPMTLLGSSTKIAKGSDKRDTYVMYLQPADKVAATTLCPMAESSGCKEPCLISSGHLGMSTAQNAATKRTVLMLTKPDAFTAQLLREIDKAERKAERTGIPALFRLNGTSDVDFSHIYALRPASQFYDYTKVLSRVRKNTQANYHLTYSGSMFSTTSRRALSKAVQRGYNIAVAFNTKGLADDALKIPAALSSFDTTDLRPLDAQGSIGTLTRKGSNKAQRASEHVVESFFVTTANLPAFNQIIARAI